MLYIKNIVNGEIYPIHTKIDRITYIVKMDCNLVWLHCLPTTPYKVVKI